MLRCQLFSVSANIKDNPKMLLARLEFCEAILKLSSCSSLTISRPGDRLFLIRFVAFSDPQKRSINLQPLLSTCVLIRHSLSNLLGVRLV
jgi:hypothetical protein